MMQKTNYERETDLGQFTTFLFGKIYVLICAGLILAFIVLGYKFITSSETMLQTTKTMVVPSTEYVGCGKIYLGSDIDTNKAEAIQNYVIGNDVLQNVLGSIDFNIIYDDLYNMVSLARSTDSVLTISIIGKDKTQVKKLIDVYISVAMKKISEKFDNDQVMLLEPAYLYSQEYSETVTNTQKSITVLLKNLVIFLVAGFLAGFVISSAYYFIIFIFDGKIRDYKEVEACFEAPILGYVPISKNTQNKVKKS